MPVQLYESWLPELAPPWLQGPRGRALLAGWGKALDEYAALVSTGLLVRVVMRAPEDALTLIGTERGLTRYPGESLEAFRARVLAAWDFWRWGGTEYGMRRWIEAAGYDVFIYEHYKNNPAIWAEFSVWVWPRIPAYTTDRWDDGGAWDDGTPWEYSLSLTELSRIPALIQEVKPAHAKLRTAFYIPGFKDVWDDSTLWDSGGAWNPEPTVIV
nr:phage tail protein [Meiothermus hypogaeus]